QGGPARRGVNGRVGSAAGMRMNASWAPSGDQAGSASSSTLGSRKRSALVARSYTPTNPWSPRPLTNASFVPSGDQWSDCARPCVGRPGELADLLPVVLFVARHRPALIVGAGRDPDVAHALRVEDPGERPTRRSRHELVRERCGERLLDCEGALLSGGGSGG